MEHTQSSKQIIMAEVMPPERANFTGHIHGGYLLLLMDRAAYACAARYSSSNVVTVTVDEVLFKKPIFVGELVTFYASINHVGNTSMVIGIRVTAENLKTGEIRHTNTSYFTMVAIDENGKPTKVPPLALVDETDKRRFHEAEIMKQLRKEYEAKRQKLKSS